LIDLISTLNIGGVAAMRKVKQIVDAFEQQPRRRLAFSKLKSGN
jgi:hypothetical protein